MIDYNNQKLKSKITKFLLFFLLVILLIFFIFPIFWTFLTSIKANIDAWSMPPKFIFSPSLENYRIVLFEKDFTRFILHSLIVGVLSTFIAIFIGTPLAYALARSRFRFNNVLFIFIFIAYIIPPIVLSIPLYVLGAGIGLLDSYIIIVLTHVTFTLAFTVWMMKGFFEEIPLEVEESSMVDGCSYLMTLLRIAIPMVRSGLAATIIFCFILSWNDFMYALVLTGVNTRTVPVSIAQFLTPHGMFWGQMSAAGCLAILPVLIFAMFFQRFLIRGMTLGAIK